MRTEPTTGPFMMSLLLLGAACGDPSAQESIGSTCTAFSQARAAYWQRCQTGADMGDPADVDRQRNMSESCESLATAPGSTLTPSDIAGCTREFEVASCGAYPSCAYTHNRRLFPSGRQGTLAVGEACVAHHQCASGLCSGSEFWQCGQCLELREVGETCVAPHQRCVTSSDNDAGATCRDGVCHAGEAGEPCSFHGGPFCDERDFFCGWQGEPGSWHGELGTCVPHLELGAPCEPGYDRCRDGYCGQGRCVALPPLGAPCGPPECGEGICREGTCQLPRTDLAQGTPCGYGDGCAEGLQCDQVCKPWSPPPVVELPGDGEACIGWLCADDHTCIQGVCVWWPKPKSGEACGLVQPQTYILCDDHHICIEGVCRPEPKRGEACVSEQGYMYCGEDELVCVGGTCVPTGPVLCGP
jgi:hypothetical protein